VPGFSLAWARVFAIEREQASRKPLTRFEEQRNPVPGFSLAWARVFAIEREQALRGNL
jgi:hypothetical protein